MSNSNIRVPRTPIVLWQKLFLRMLPTIRRSAAVAFRGLTPEAREEAVADVIANAWCAYLRLVERNKAHLAFATVLANFAIRQHRSGRRVGAKLNVRDIASPYCQAAKRVTVGRLDHYDHDEAAWKEVLIEDKHVTPAELAASRIDFPAWLNTLSRRDRRLAMALASGERTNKVAKLFTISAGRVSQLRTELRNAWLRFQGESPAVPNAA